MSEQETTSTSEVHSVDSASRSFVGLWNHLVSTTNWEKGHIIFRWREALVAAEAPSTEFSDEAWARRVGGITGQHVGRLRRVYERFGEVRASYDGLYWSHFQAALDWDDSEMWLEGAVQNRWSVSKMRDKRWETLGGSEEDKPRDEEIILTEINEDVDASAWSSEAQSVAGETAQVQPAARGKVPDDDGDAEDGDAEEGNAGDDWDADSEPATRAPAEVASGAATAAPTGRSNPLANLPELPEDFEEATEMMKLAILRHKNAGWTDIARDDALAVLDALRQFVVTPVRA